MEKIKRQIDAFTRERAVVDKHHNDQILEAAKITTFVGITTNIDQALGKADHHANFTATPLIYNTTQKKKTKNASASYERHLSAWQR